MALKLPHLSSMRLKLIERTAIPYGKLPLPKKWVMNVLLLNSLANAKAPPGWHNAPGRIIFDVKMDFTRKARWVKDGHTAPDSETSSFAGVVSCDSIQIALTHAALLGLPVIGANICNAYLQAPSSEKHFIVCGPELGIKNEDHVALSWCALYGGKVAGRDF